MAIEWYNINDNLSIGVDWNDSVNETSVDLSPVVYRWDRYNTDNHGGNFSETLSPDPSGDGSWSGLTFGKGSGEREIDTFAKRTYNRGNANSTVSLTISWTNIGTHNGSSYVSIGNGSNTWKYTVPAKNKFTVTYNSNGGTGTMSSSTVTYGDSFKTSENTFIRYGYTFNGWNEKADGTGVAWKLTDEGVYESGLSWTWNYTKDITLYAQWIENKLTISYYSNYATSYNGTEEPKNTVDNNNVFIYSVDYYYDDAYLDGLPNYTNGSTLGMLRTGYIGTGYWGTSVDGGKLIGENESFNYGYEIAERLGCLDKLQSSDVIIRVYAQWQIITYTVSYDLNGGIGEFDDQTKTWGTDLTLHSGEPTWVGYLFDYWCTTSDGTGIKYLPGDIYSTESDVALYAIWKYANVGWMKVDGEYKKYNTYVKVNGKWKPFIAYWKDENGVWRQGII